MNFPRLTPRRLGLATGVLLFAWMATVFAGWLLATTWKRPLYEWGLGGWFVVGLCWAIWWIECEAQRREHLRRQYPELPPTWNPFDLAARYYGATSQRLKQSLLAVGSYSGVFLMGLLLSQFSGCSQALGDDLPAGGGVDQAQQQKVVIQKVIRKKFVINPYSGIVFNPPPIDDVKTITQEDTKNLYQVGQGNGPGGPGFGAGKAGGKVHFVRLQYDGGDWDQDFGPVGPDFNMLLKYGELTQQAVHDKVDSVSVGQLAGLKQRSSKFFPLLYMTGQKNITLTANDKRLLKEYLLDKHGMVLGSNGGSQTFHNAFVGLMREVTGVDEVRVPLDDNLHQRPYSIPFVPIVAPHGGKDALGWKVDGRWVAYYHPGDIHDAWKDDHSGVSRDVYDACYRLGANIIFYAHSEYSQWLQAQAAP